MIGDLPVVKTLGIKLDLAVVTGEVDDGGFGLLELDK